MPEVPDYLQTLVDRWEPDAFDAPSHNARVRLALSRSDKSWDVTIKGREARIRHANPDRKPDATLTADERTWRKIGEDIRGGMEAYGKSRLRIRHNLHIGVGFLAATSGMTDPGRLEFHRVKTRKANISYLQAGTGPNTVVCIHGLGGTKGSFLPTVAALADEYRVIALDLPGFGDSDKPIAAGYDAAYFADAVTAFLDELAIHKPYAIGNSMGGRVALELGFEHPDRIHKLALLAPSLAWLRDRKWAAPLRLLRPELGLVQIAPRPIVDNVVRRLIPGADDGWTAAGVDEFLRAYLQPRGRAAFYAAARNIYLEQPHGDNGFWTRLAAMETESLFVWGRNDRVVPLSFAHHVADALPGARHVELDCGHVPQVERPAETHRAVREFFATKSASQQRKAPRAATA